MAEATSIVFTPLDAIGTYQRALVTAVASSDETITLTGNEYRISEIKAITSAHISLTGVPVTVSYTEAGVFTLETASLTDQALVVEILYN